MNTNIVTYLEQFIKSLIATQLTKEIALPILIDVGNVINSLTGNKITPEHLAAGIAAAYDIESDLAK